MTSPLVKPAAGYSTLSRLDSSRSRAPTRTRRRSGIDTLLRAQVRAQPQEAGKAQPAVRRALPVLDFHHNLRTYPGRVLRILPREFRGERRLRYRPRPQLREQCPLGGRRDPAADPATEEQFAARTGYPDQQRTERPRPGPEPADHELRGVLGLVLDPVERADTGPVRRVQPLGHDALQA